MKRTDLRQCVFLLLFRTPFFSEEEMTEQEGLYLSLAVDDDSAHRLSQKDAALVRERYDAVKEHLPQIDALLEERTVGWDIQRIGKVELAILRLAVFELQFDEDVPTPVAINEAVELAKRYGQEGAASFVNGVLAKFA